MRHRRPKTAALTIATGLLTAACTAPTGGTDANGATPAPAVDTTATPEPAPAPPQQGALDEFTLRIWGAITSDDPQVRQAAEEQRVRAEEEYIAACMTAQGFTYYPRTMQVTVTVTEGPLPGSREFAERFGFGISGLAGGVLGGGQLNVGSRQVGPDPNWELRDAMSEAERTAWDEALRGDWAAIPEDGVIDWSQQGCWGQALMASFPNIRGTALNEEFRAISDELTRFQDAAELDPRMIAFHSEWAACMTQAGYPGWRNPRHVDRALFDEFLGIQDADPTFDLLAEWDWEAEPDGPPPFERDTASLREREMALALADIDCREALDFDAREREVVLVLQQEFVDRNRDELEAWASAAETLRAGRTP